VLIKKVLIGAIANGIAYDSAHGRVYVSSMATDSIYEIDAATNAVVRMFYGGTTPQEVVLTPDHSEVWVANESDAGILIFDRATGDSIGSVPNTERAFGLAVSPDGERFYVTMLALGTFSIIDRNTRTVLSTQSGGFNSAPGRIRFNQSGTSAVIADEGMGMIVIQ
jgi:YVTN family beta-propeller protein